MINLLDKIHQIWPMRSNETASLYSHPCSCIASGLYGSQLLCCPDTSLHGIQFALDHPSQHTLLAQTAAYGAVRSSSTVKGQPAKVHRLDVQRDYELYSVITK